MNEEKGEQWGEEGGGAGRLMSPVYIMKVGWAPFPKGPFEAAATNALD